MRRWVILNLWIKGLAVFAAAFFPAWALALWLLPDALLIYSLFAPHASGLVRSCRRFQPNAREVWLTIDDGPDPIDTPQILRLLAEHDARATFFVIGQKARQHPELIRAIVAAGHEIGHHTQNHLLSTFWCASRARLAHELDACLTTLKALGVAPTRFRSPANIKNVWLASLLNERRLRYIDWTTRGLERRGTNPAAVARRATQHLAPGNILLLHEGPRVPPAVRVEAIRQVLCQLRENGYRAVIPSDAQLGR